MRLGLLSVGSGWTSVKMSVDFVGSSSDRSLLTGLILDWCRRIVSYLEGERHRITLHCKAQ